MNPRLFAPLAALAAALLLLSLSVFTVGENEVALRTRFGQLQPGSYAPGLHWCWPFDRIVRIDRRLAIQRLQAESFLDRDQQGLSVDIDLGWRVHDAAQYQRIGADANVLARLDDAVRSELKGYFARSTLAQILLAPRGGFSDQLLGRLRPAALALGVELVDARVKRIDPTDEATDAIYARMQSAYAAESRQIRAEGAANGERLRAEAEQKRAGLLAAANRDAQRIRGEGDAQAAAIYARAFAPYPEFAAFYRTLQAYRKALVREGDILVIEPDGEFYKYLHNPARH